MAWNVKLERTVNMLQVYQRIMEFMLHVYQRISKWCNTGKHQINFLSYMQVSYLSHNRINYFQQSFVTWYRKPGNGTSISTETVQLYYDIQIYCTSLHYTDAFHNKLLTCITVSYITRDNTIYSSVSIQRHSDFKIVPHQWNSQKVSNSSIVTFTLNNGLSSDMVHQQHRVNLEQ